MATRTSVKVNVDLEFEVSGDKSKVDIRDLLREVVGWDASIQKINNQNVTVNNIPPKPNHRVRASNRLHKWSAIPSNVPYINGQQADPNQVMVLGGRMNNWNGISMYVRYRDHSGSFSIPIVKLDLLYNNAVQAAITEEGQKILMHKGRPYTTPVTLPKYDDPSFKDAWVLLSQQILDLFK